MRVRRARRARAGPGAVCLDGAALPAQAKLDREPVAGGQLANVLLGGAQRRQPDLLRELGERAVGKERRVAQQLVARVRFRRVERTRRVAQVLRRVEDAERLLPSHAQLACMSRTRPARKSRELSRPETGRRRKPVQSCRNWDTSSSCGMLSAA